MAHVFILSCDAFAQRIASYAVVCDALCSALLLQSALDALEPLSLGPIKFRTWHLRIPKNMSQTHTRAHRGGRVWRPCGTAGPGTSPSDARENFPSEKPNEHESNSPRKARRPARGERLRFLEPERRRTGRPGAGREWEPARNVPRPPPFRRRSSLSDASSQFRRIPRGVSKTASCADRLVPA